LQAAFIVDQMAENVGKTHDGDEELAFMFVFLASAIRSVEQVEGYS